MVLKLPSCKSGNSQAVKVQELGRLGRTGIPSSSTIASWTQRRHSEEEIGTLWLQLPDVPQLCITTSQLLFIHVSVSILRVSPLVVALCLPALSELLHLPPSLVSLPVLEIGSSWVNKPRLYMPASPSFHNSSRSFSHSHLPWHPSVVGPQVWLRFGIRGKLRTARRGSQQSEGPLGIRIRSLSSLRHAPRTCAAGAENSLVPA
jgi:hypothetical protein